MGAWGRGGVARWWLGPGAAEGTAPEVPAVVGDSLSGAVGGRGLQHHNLHLLAGVALGRGHGALPLPRRPHADVRQGQLAVGGRAEGGLAGRGALGGRATRPKRPGPLHPPRPDLDRVGQGLRGSVLFNGARDTSTYSFNSDWPYGIVFLSFRFPTFIMELIIPPLQVYWRDSVP